jgi:DNA primase
VLIAYDRDEAGDRAAEKLTRELTAEGLDCYRIQFPKGMDANEYALKVTPAAKSLGIVIRKAQWLGKGEAPIQNADAVADPPIEKPAAKEEIPPPTVAAAAPLTVAEAVDVALPASPVPAPAAPRSTPRCRARRS